MSVLVNTVSTDAYGTGSINLGYEIVREKYNLEPVNFKQVLDKVPEVVYGNVFYPMQLINFVSFMKRNNIPILKGKRSTRVILGGQGVSNVSCMNDIADEIFKGEADGDYIDQKGWSRKSVIDTQVRVKNKLAAIELTRGCKYRCKFCEYGCVQGGKYREKDINLVKDQIIETLPITRNMNFMSANFGGYSKLDELMDFCHEKNVYVMNTDVNVRDVNHAVLKYNKSARIGVESFNEETRRYANKPVTDEELLNFFKTSVQTMSSIHCYLIFGLPHENYAKWFEWIAEVAKIRKPISHPIRVEFPLTNFEPVPGTPFEHEARVNFYEKDKFLEEWSRKLVENGFRAPPKDESKVVYFNHQGKFGKMQSSYELLMALKTEKDLNSAFINALHAGVDRSVDDRQAKSFLKYIGNNDLVEPDYVYLKRSKNKGKK